MPQGQAKSWGSNSGPTPKDQLRSDKCRGESSAGTEVPPRNLGRSQIRGGVGDRVQGAGSGRETSE